MKAVIFDMDGVLIDSQQYHYKADINTMKDYGVFEEKQFYEAFAGTTTYDRMNMLKDMFSLTADVYEMTAKREQMIIDIMRNEEVYAIKGIPELLSSIKSKDMKIAVASSSSYELINMILYKIGIAEYFDSITSGVDVKRGKPSPDVFLLSSQRIGVSPKNCVVVEDSENGIKASISAGMTAIGYINPTSGNQCLDGAKLVTDDFTKIDADLICKL